MSLFRSLMMKGKGDSYEETVLFQGYNMSSSGGSFSYSALPQTVNMADGDYIKVDLRGLAKPLNTGWIFSLSKGQYSSSIYMSISVYKSFSQCYIGVQVDSYFLARLGEIKYPADISFTIRRTGTRLNIEDLTVNNDLVTTSESTVDTSNIVINYYGLDYSRLYIQNYLKITYGKKL